MSNNFSNWFNQTRNRIEQRFSWWGHICHKNPWWIIVSVATLLAWSTSYLHTLTVDTSTEGFLHKDDPIRVYYDKFKHEFGRDEKAIILVEGKFSEGGDIINDDFLKRLQALHTDLENVAQIADIKSLINARNTYGENDELIVDDLLENWPQSEQEFSQLRETVKNNPTYINQFVNKDLTMTALILTMDTYSSEGVEIDELAGFDTAVEFEQPPSTDLDQENQAKFLSGQEVSHIIHDIDAVLEKHQTADFQLHGTGSPYMMHLLTTILGTDMFKFSFFAVIFISILLFLLFRRVVMIFLPICVAILSTYFTIALMAFFGIPITTSVQILPSFLLAVSVGSSVHIFTVFFQGLNKGLDKSDALAYALGHSGLAVVMTGLTTAGGLLSFYSAEIKPVSDFGLVTPMGILSTLFFSLVLLPALIAVIPIKNKALKDNSNSINQRFLAWCGNVSTQYPARVIFGWLIVLVPSLYLASGITVSHYPLGWFPEDSNYRMTTEKFGAEFGGSSYMEIMVDTGVDDGIKDPKVLQAMDDIQTMALNLNVSQVQTRKTISVTDVNKELHQALNNNDENYYKIPTDRQLVAQELLLFENSGSDDLEELVDTRFSKARITLKMPFVDATHYPPYLEALEKNVREIIGDKAEINFTGILAMMSRTVVSLLNSTVTAYIIAFCIITPLMVFLIGSIRIGLISMIPNLTPIIITMALMAITGIPLDAFTLLIGSIALGLAVDDTIHFMHNFQRFYANTKDSVFAVKETLRTTGEALFFTSVVLSGSFFIYMFATMKNLFAFGLLTGFCIIIAFLADVLLAPALVTVLTRYKENKEREKHA